MTADDLLEALSFVLWEQQLADVSGTAFACGWARLVAALADLPAGVER